MRATCSSFLCSDEPCLADVLEDPVILAVMARDGVRRTEMADLVCAVRKKLATLAEKPAPRA
jgi:hypothetical protein